MYIGHLSRPAEFCDSKLVTIAVVAGLIKIWSSLLLMFILRGSHKLVGFIQADIFFN